MSDVKPQGRLPVRVGYYVFATLVLIALIYSLLQLAGALIASLLFAFVLAPIVNYAENRGVNRVLVVFLIYLLVVAVLLILIVFVGPILSREVMSLTSDLPAYQEQLKAFLEDVRGAVNDRFPALELPELYPYVTGLVSLDGFDLSSILSRVSGVFSVLMVLVIIPVITFFFIVDAHLIQKAVLRLVPNRYFEMSVLLINKTGTALQRFIRGQLIDALYVGVMTTIGMAIIGLPYFVVIGLFAGLGKLIPYLGPIIGFIPAFFVTLLTPGWFTVGNLALIAGIFILVQVTESTFVYPVAIGKSVNLHPLAVFLGITIGGRLAGIVGMIIAVPLISIVKVVLETVSAYLKSYKVI